MYAGRPRTPVRAIVFLCIAPEDYMLAELISA